MSNTKNLASFAAVLDDGTSGQVLTSQGSGVVAFADASGGGGGMTVYATLAALSAVSSPSNGDQAFVTANNTVYVRASSGWRKIATVQEAPGTVTGHSASYPNIADNATTDITLSCTDPEGFDVTWSYAVGGNGTLSGSNINNSGGDTLASISVQTVNSNSGGVNTITYRVTRQTTSVTGDFTITFTATDSQSTGTSDTGAIAFTLAFSTPNSRYTFLLMNGDGAGDNNDGISDSSSNNGTVTVVGDCFAGSFSPYRSGGYSVHFDGNDYFTTTITASGTSDFSLSMWIYLEALGSGNFTVLFDSRTSDGDSSGFALVINSDRKPYLITGGGAYGAASSDPVIPLNGWSWVVLNYSSGSMTISVDGTSGTAVSVSLNLTRTSADIGTKWNNAYYMDGYITDLSLKTATISTSVPTERVDATNATLQICHLPYFSDNLTIYGDPTTEPFSPYDYKEYTAADHGGSIYFDGSGDWLTVPDHADLNFGSNDWTIQMWIYLTGTGSEYSLWSQASDSASESDDWFAFYIDAPNQRLKTILENDTLNSDKWVAEAGNYSVRRNSWYHVALSRSFGNHIKIYSNGKEVASYAGYVSSAMEDKSYDHSIGRRKNSSSGNPFIGHIADFKIDVGTAISGEFTPPTAPLSSSNADMLIKGTGAKVLDKAQSINFDLKGNTASTSALTSSSTPPRIGAAWDNTSAVYFDGNGDYIPVISNFFYNKNTSNASTTKFTIETWVYHTARLSSSGYSHIFQTIVGLGEIHMAFGIDHDGYLKFYHQTSSNHVVTSSSTISLNTWTHIAVIVDGSQGSSGVTLKINGTTDGTGTWNGINSTLSYHQQGLSDPHFTIGRYPNSFQSYQQFEGYLQDLRISSTARTITAAPSAPLKG